LLGKKLQILNYLPNLTYLTASPRSAMQQLPSDFTKIFFVLMSL
jgi:hypothetical protein